MLGDKPSKPKSEAQVDVPRSYLLLIASLDSETDTLNFNWVLCLH